MCTCRGSNQGPLGPKSKALTTAPLRHLPFLRLYLQSKQLRSCQDGLLKPHCSWASFPVAAYQYTVSILLQVTGNMLFLNQRKREYFFIKTCAGCEATYFCDYRPSYRVQCMTLCSLWPPNYLAVYVYLTFHM